MVDIDAVLVKEKAIELWNVRRAKFRNYSKDWLHLSRVTRSHYIDDAIEELYPK